MPIELYTGQPGNGKTALMMERLLDEAKRGQRPIFAAGIDGLQPGLATVLDDPRDWNKIDAVTGEHVVPNGSLIFVDEAWKWFGHLHDATRQATPKHVLDLAEHRHRGLDFVWTTQQPNQLYPFVRGLIGSHAHVVRRFGTKMIDVFKWGELNEDVKSSAKRDLAQRTTRLLPSQAFGAYKSAEVHTIKPRIPMKVMALPALALGAIIAGYLAYQSLRPDNMSAKAGGGIPVAQATESASGVPASTQADAPKFKDATDYARQHLPRFAMMPWTAPVFDDRAVTADPAVICISSLAGKDAQGEWKEASCTCLTEQGTLYDLSQPECRTIARRGPVYNPYKERNREGSMQAQQLQQDSVMVQGGVSLPGVVIGRRTRSQGTFPESPGYTASSSVTPATGLDL